ncbi:MAG: galactose-1-phosphate uridylyltransferase [Candidatus Micrarchaeota archaeon]
MEKSIENELRKDSFLERWVIIARKRHARPQDFSRNKKISPQTSPKACFFCPGNENLTPPEITRLPKASKWRVRAFPNKFAAVSKDSKSAYGAHEVIVETPKHGERLSQISSSHMLEVLEVFSARINSLARDKRMKYVLLFKNEGKEAGASLEHTHTQLISLACIPSAVLEEISASSAYKARRKKCPFCELSNEKNERLILENKHASVLAPYASRFPFEMWVLPKKHTACLTKLKKEEKRAFAEALSRALKKLDKLLANPSYNLVFHISPLRSNSLHFHVEICPRLSVWAGFEFGSGIIINTMPPEEAAKALRTQFE